MEETAANRVRELREARGWSQSVLAETVGLSRQSVFAIETGRALPAVDIALRLAKALDCPVEGLAAAYRASRELRTPPAWC